VIDPVMYLPIAFIIFAVVVFYLAARLRRKAGIPAGRIVYVDASQWNKVEKPLYDRELRLTGKPDYLVQQGKQVIPIEVKSGHAPPQAHEWHISQLAAYCILVEREYGTRPAHGFLHYADRTLEIDFTPLLETSTLAIIQEMQKRTSQIQIDRSHHDQNRCIYCGYRSICDQALRI
jgi:CRISPR-associated exonuclease Cas4